MCVVGGGETGIHQTLTLKIRNGVCDGMGPRVGLMQSGPSEAWICFGGLEALS